MTTLAFPELDEAVGRKNAKLDQMAAIMAEAKTEDGKIDLSRVKSIDGDAEAKAEAFRKLNDEVTDLTKTIARLQPVADAAALVEGREPADARTEKGADATGESRKAAPTFADLYLKSGSAENKGREFELEDVDVKTTFITSAGWAPDTVRESRVVDYATRPIELLDFIPTVTTTQSSITYMEETTFTNAAVEVTEGSAKPEAALALTERTAVVRKIAVFLPVTDEQLEDVGAVREYLNSRLGFMVRQRLAGQIVAGDGSAPNIRGILNVVGIQTQAKGADPTPDAVYKAITKVRVTGQAEPDAFVTHPNDWQDIRLLRTTDGIYIWGNPSEAGPEMIWGLNVVQAQAMTENTGVVGAWRTYSTLFVRRGLTVETGYNSDDWTKNKQTIRAEMRAVPVFWRPAAFCTVTGI
jgi:HK97 family phage major capsid protein